MEVKLKIESYPEDVRLYAEQFRTLILDTAKELGIGKIEESLKWGEPSFKAKNGSPIRMDWKSNTPNNFYIFFNCKSMLVETFKAIYSSDLIFEGSRAIILDFKTPMPVNILKQCISLALRYHKLKNLPLLGA